MRAEGGPLTQPLIGSFKGKLEIAWALTRDEFEKSILRKGFVVKQECFLLLKTTSDPDVYGSVQAYLLYHDGREENLGYFGPVCPTSASLKDGWTLDTDKNQYYATG